MNSKEQIKMKLGGKEQMPDAYDYRLQFEYYSRTLRCWLKAEREYSDFGSLVKQAAAQTRLGDVRAVRLLQRSKQSWALISAPIR